jgi:RimJ/RimL family protein N-acetyltransferase
VVMERSPVRLQPLSMDVVDDLAIAAAHQQIWSFMPVRPILTKDAMRDWVEQAIKGAADGTQFAFAIMDTRTEKAIGSTRYMDIRTADKGMEIGWTWLTPEYQRTIFNTTCKFLLMNHAFENLGAVRVQLKTDGRNLKSQAAIERLGAKREGVLRKQLALPDGYIRDTVYFSVLDSEWPDVKARLLALLEEPRPDADGSR